MGFDAQSAEDIASDAVLGWYERGEPEVYNAKYLVTDAIRKEYGRTGSGKYRHSERVGREAVDTGKGLKVAAPEERDVAEALEHLVSRVKLRRGWRDFESLTHSPLMERVLAACQDLGYTHDEVAGCLSLSVAVLMHFTGELKGEARDIVMEGVFELCSEVAKRKG